MRALVFVPLALALMPAPANACSCIEVPPATAYAEHDAVFEGRVVEVGTSPDPAGRVRVTFEVVQQWKGVETERVVVTTATNPAACGVGFETETSWLVYADDEDGELRTGLCSRTRRIEEAADDLVVLGAGVVPVEIGEADEVEDPAPREPPARAGCASCAVAAPRPWPAGLVLVAAALFAARRRRA